MKPSPSSKTTSGAKAAHAPLTLKDKILRVLGPGLITGASDDDPSGIATYSQAGAQFGFSITWTLLFTYPLMAAIQEISAASDELPGRGSLRIYGNIIRIGCCRALSRQDATFAIIVEAHSKGDIFHSGNDEESPEHERKRTQNNARVGRLCCHVQNGFESIKRAGADIPEHDPECCQTQNWQVTLRNAPGCPFN
jgi:Natural resistance-associated macrophage protein